MIVRSPSAMTPGDYDLAALEYLKNLPMEHFMEATPQATQREITVVSFGVLKTIRDDFHYFNELLVQYWHNKVLRQIVPDNMIVQGDLPIHDRPHYSIPLEPLHPMMVLEYVSQSNPNKDYVVSFEKYENELKPTYCLIFDPARQDLRVFHHTGEEFVRLEPNQDKRCTVPELNLEVGILNRWVRFWHKDILLEITPELRSTIAAKDKQLVSKDKQLVSKEKQLVSKEKQLVSKEKKIAKQDKQIAQHKTENAQIKGKLTTSEHKLRQLVETRARSLNRDDVLSQVGGADIEQLTSWLTELI